YVLKQWQAMRDAESRKEHAEDLLAAQRRLMAEAQHEIEQIVGRSPEIRKLQDLGARAAREGEANGETRRRVADLVEAVRKHTEVRARLERLRASEAALKDRITGLQALVASQKDAQVKQYNQGLL